MRTLTLKKGNVLAVNGEAAAEIVEINRGSVVIRLLPSGKLVEAEPERQESVMPAQKRRKRCERLSMPRESRAS